MVQGDSLRVNQEYSDVFSEDLTDVDMVNNMMKFEGYVLIPSIDFDSNRLRGRDHKNLPPPSPPKLPIVGNLHQLGLFSHRSLRSLAKKYGPLMQLHFGSVPVLVVSSAVAAREIMKTHDLAFSSRPKTINGSKIVYDCKDVALSPYGEVALGRKYSGTKGGRRFKELLATLTELIGVFDVGDYIPWLVWMNRINGLDAKVENVSKEMNQFLEGVVEEHVDRSKRDDSYSANIGNENKHDFVDLLLQIQLENTSGSLVHRDTIKALILVKLLFVFLFNAN
ncbi:cytochrome P450 71A24-like [Camellia sinensis]|uniref:cytochrome P450 71A24-like n=1 Tax=Camellia sinensis TaxID=4442 RepID=UPI001035C3F7|nr:cytochrome P450 71A24-like [Camellia sinensis]